MIRLGTIVAVSILAIGAGGPAAVRAEEPSAAGKPLPEFRRIIFPVEELNTRHWNQRYLPVDAAEFEQHLHTVYDAARGAPDDQRVRIDKGDYQVRLDADDLLVGTANWHLVSRPATSTLLTLEPCSVALESAAWASPAKPAVLGLDPSGRLCTLVEGSELACRWSQRGERTAAGAVKFHLQLPACPMARMVLDTAPGVEVVADHGIVTPVADAGPETLRWHIDFGGHNQLTLRIVTEEAVRERRPLTLLRQAVTYEFSSRGIDVTTQLRLDVHGEPLQRARIHLDPGMHLIAARYGELAVPWSAASDPDTGGSHVVLEFPEPVEGTGRVLQLTAVAPLTTGEPVRLPGIQPQDMAWQEGTADLLVPDTLVLDQLTTVGCRQSRLTALPAPLSGESFEIQYFRPGATVEVLLSEPRRKLALATAASVRIGADEITSRSTLKVTDAQQHGLLVPIGDDWTIDAVESLSTERPIEWDVDESPGKPAALKIVPDGAGLLVVRGHRALPLESQFDASRLEMLDLSAFGGQTRLISVRPAEGSELQWTGLEEIERHDATALADEQLQLFPQLPEGLVFTADDRFLQATLSLKRRKPAYTADIHIDAAVQQDRLTETFTIQCTPEAARVDRLLVHFSQAREVPLEWNLAGGNNSGQFSARKLSSGEQVKEGLPAEGEVWELLLQLARAGTFELRGQRSIPFVAETPLALASIDDATTQRGTLAIRALGNSGLSIKNRGLMSVPAELLEQDRYQTARATYHYQPSGDGLEAEPIVSIAPAQPEQSETGAWVWNLRLTSRYAADGKCVHHAVAHIQTAGRRRLQLRLPAGAEFHAALLDDERLPELPEAAESKVWPIEFPAGRSRVTLSIDYSMPSRLPTLATLQAAPFPALDAPIVLREWSVWMPPGYAVSGAVDRVPLDQQSPLSWSQRLFGPLGRGRFDHVFNPLVAADWREMFTGSQTIDLARQTGGQFVENLGVLAGDYLDGEDLTWGQLLSSAGETEAAIQPHPAGRFVESHVVGHFAANAGETPRG